MYRKDNFLTKTTKPQNLSEVGDRGLQEEGGGQEYGIYIPVFAFKVLDFLQLCHFWFGVVAFCIMKIDNFSRWN